MHAVGGRGGEGPRILKNGRLNGGLLIIGPGFPNLFWDHACPTIGVQARSSQRAAICNGSSSPRIDPARYHSIRSHLKYIKLSCM